MSRELNWVALDIVSACIKSNISVNFRNDKRFYRVRLKDCCGIFDLRSHSFLETSELIFSAQMDKTYRLAANDLHSIEAVARQCPPETDELSPDEGILPYQQLASEQTTLSIDTKLLN